MTDAAPSAILQGIFRRLGRSLLQYVRDAFPWTSPADRDRLAVLNQLIDEEEQAAAELAAWLRRRRVPPPPLGPYPMTFTNIHYLSLDHVLPHLLAEEKGMVAALEADVSRLWDDLQAREQAQKALDLARRHQQALEQLAAKSAAATPA